MIIGKRIRYLRQKNNYKLENLCKGIISNTHLSNIEAGRFIPSKDILILLSRKFKVVENYLVDFDTLDKGVESLIDKLELSILYNNNDVEELIHGIDKTCLSNVTQELKFKLLQFSYLQKKGYLKEAKNIDSLILTYIEDIQVNNIDPHLARLYYYYLGLKAYFNNCLEESYHNFTKLTELTSNNIVKAPYLYNLALITKKQYKYLEAISYSKEALNIYLTTNQDWEKIGETYNFIGATYWDLNKMEEALGFLGKAKQIQELINNQELRARIYHNLGLVYKASQKFEIAFKYFYEAIDIKKKHNYNPLISYRALIDLHLKDNNLELVDQELRVAKLLVRRELDKYLLLAAHSDFLEQKGDLISSISELEECISFLEEHKNTYHLKNLYNKLGDRYFKLKKYKLAATNYKKELNLSKGKRH